MRILHISTRLILGGSQENTVLSCEGQLRSGHEVHLAYGPIFGPEGSLFQRVDAFRSDSRRIGLHEVPDLCREVSPLRDARCVSQLRALIHRVQPHIVHTHSSKAGILGRYAAWTVTPRPAIVHTIHGPPFMPLDGLAGLTRMKVKLLNDGYERAERFAARRCDVIVSVADDMTRQFLERRIGRPEQFETVYSGIDVGPYLEPAAHESREQVRARLGFQPGDIVIGTVARLAEHKGHDDLLDGLAGALRTSPHLKLLWVGDGWRRSRLVERARSMQLTIGGAGNGQTPMIVLTGLVEPARVPGLMRAMDILAHPSLREGLPRTVPQALLCGVPPVAYDSDGTREACIPDRTGLLVPRGDAARLSAAILRLSVDRALRQHLGSQGFAFVRERFCAERMIAELERVYARAASLRGTGGALMRPTI